MCVYSIPRGDYVKWDKDTVSNWMMMWKKLKFLDLGFDLQYIYPLSVLYLYYFLLYHNLIIFFILFISYLTLYHIVLCQLMI